MTNAGEYTGGESLEGEDQWIGGILQGLEFDPGAWLAHGMVLRLTWSTLVPDKDAEAHRRLYFGPLRLPDHLQQVQDFEDIRAGYLPLTWSELGGA